MDGTPPANCAGTKSGATRFHRCQPGGGEKTRSDVDGGIDGNGYSLRGRHRSGDMAAQRRYWPAQSGADHPVTFFE